AAAGGAATGGTATGGGSGSGGSAGAPAPMVTEIPLPVTPTGESARPWALAVGPDDNLWITEEGSKKIARMTTAGVVTEFSLPVAGASPHGITKGPDGAMWFTMVDPGGKQIGR